MVGVDEGQLRRGVAVEHDERHSGARRGPSRRSTPPLQPRRQIEREELFAADIGEAAGVVDQHPVVQGFDGQPLRLWLGRHSARKALAFGCEVPLAVFASCARPPLAPAVFG